MIIIGQYGSRYNFDNIIIYKAVMADDFGQVICKLVNNETCVLGDYETFERAEEVVEELDNCYCSEKFYKSNQTFERVMAVNTAPRVFFMPKE